MSADRLVQTRHQHTTDAAFSHIRPRVISTRDGDRSDPRRRTGATHRRDATKRVAHRRATILERQVDALRRTDRRYLARRLPRPSARGLPVHRLADRTPGAARWAVSTRRWPPQGKTTSCCSPATCRTSRPPMLAHLIRRRGGADAVVPRTERGYHPLCAVYDAACRPPVERRLAGGVADAGTLRAS